MPERGNGTGATFDTDIAVVGAGPAGIAAAVSAAEAGRRVVVLDEGIRPGGQIWRHTSRAHLPRTARRWLERLDSCEATVLRGASVIDVSPGFGLTAECDDRPRMITAASLILATGARERFLPFPGWTLPGVIGAGGAQALIKSGADLKGKRAVVAGSGPLLLAAAGALARGGVHVSWIAEQAAAVDVYGFATSLWRTPRRVAQAIIERAATRAARYITGAWVERAEGDDVVRSVTLTNGTRRWTVPCDLLCTGFGLVAATELPRALGCTVLRGRVLVDENQCTTVRGVLCAGEPTGVAGVESAIVEGEIAGLVAAGRTDLARRRFAARTAHRRFASRLEEAFTLREELRALPAPDTLICRCEDVPFDRFEGHWSMREAKLRTRAGMGPCQGRVCGSALEFLFGYRQDAARTPVSPARATTLVHQASEDFRGDLS